jgi:hypothetical protein
MKERLESDLSLRGVGIRLHRSRLLKFLHGCNSHASFFCPREVWNAMKDRARKSRDALLLQLSPDTISDQILVA